FESSGFDPPAPSDSDTDPDLHKYAILSSGGKDSLLSYGILNETFEAHPVFVNEAGQHWYTAYNAYHFFDEHVPETVKVWCNSDRIFNWMVRQMPFIRKNYQDIKADIYPIRLWTVAVFLFGVLPVVRKRGIGNVVIGNEYDTTLKLNHHGITHYAALYDQSRYFDNAFTRFYRKKGWHIRQFSLLRSLSELLILKILVKRYPDLQTLQVSCHSAHKADGKMAPCGQCEKCRRIVGMLSVLGEDPRRCGYAEDQIRQCLASLATSSVKQLGSDAQHLYALLLEHGFVPDSAWTRQQAKRHPEIMCLRFDRQRSLVEDLPETVRKPLFGILKQYADGAVEHRDGQWHPCALDDTMLSKPYIIAATEHENK
ncbi:MAG: hypothetical protein R3301_14210, partial [Saprospiraceae bacterium]|nr:hypothetical protein [Saprospiraceae bacterium]